MGCLVYLHVNKLLTNGFVQFQNFLSVAKPHSNNGSTDQLTNWQTGQRVTFLCCVICGYLAL